MTNEQAIAELQKEHDLIQSEHDLDGSQFAPALLEALAMAIEVMQGDGDTISRQAAIDMLKNRWKKTCNYEGIGDDIAEECELYLKQVPSAQPERQRGRWIEYIPEHGKCPFCGNQVDLLNGKANNFCGECGADMRGEQDE